jgi:hypothetical protein
MFVCYTFAFESCARVWWLCQRLLMNVLVCAWQLMTPQRVLLAIPRNVAASLITSF